MRNLEKWLRGEDILDSLILCRMKDENRERGGAKLENLFCTEFNGVPWKGETEKILKKEKKASALTQKQRMARCRFDAWGTQKLSEKLERDVNDPELITYTHKTMMSLHRMGLAGAAVNVPLFHKLGRGWKTNAEKYRTKITHFALRSGLKEYVPTNDGQTRELLFKKLRLPVLERTEKTKEPKVSVDVLKELVRRGHTSLENLIQFNTFNKRCSTWYGSEGATVPSVAELLQPFPGNPRK